ncbi:unnamed protein product, partial [Staurois parvus]
YCVSCDWSQLVTWYKAVVNSLVPCDLCDHAQISHVVSNDVRSDILLITLHVISDCFTVSGGHSGHRIAVLRAPGERAKAGCGKVVYKRPPDPATATRPCSAT